MANKNQIVIIGAGPAGSAAAAMIRKYDKESEITILEKSKNYPYSVCAMPYVLSGEISSFDQITTYNQEFYTANDIKISLGQKVLSVDFKKKEINCGEKGFHYDKLIVATGSKSVIPGIKGLDKSEYHTMRHLDDAKKIMDKVQGVKKPVIIGAGVIGLELADALSKLKLNPVVIEAGNHALGMFLSKDMSDILEKNLPEIEIHKSEQVSEIAENQVITDKGKYEFDFLAICTGVKPEFGFEGLKSNNGFIVDERMRTSASDVYACGDCVEKSTILATNAIKQANVVAKNITGTKDKVPEFLNTAITRLGKLMIASTGKVEHEVYSSIHHGQTLPSYYPGGKDIWVKLIADKKGRITCAQIIGETGVVGRINWLALAIQKEVTAKELANSESAYNPATSQLFDPVVLAAKILVKKIK